MKKSTAVLIASSSVLILFAPLGLYWARHGTVAETVRGVTHGTRAEKTVALTFDDGPNPGYTERIVSLLNKHGARGTFFALGRNIQAHRTTAMIVAASNHQLANHGFSHQNLSELPLARQKEEILATEKLLRDVGVTGPIVFRPPYGHTGWRLRYWLWKTGRKIILWSRGAAVPDYLRRDPRVLAENLIEKIKPGAILLFHDGEGLRPETIEALDLVLHHLQREGYQAVTINELTRTHHYNAR